MAAHIVHKGKDLFCHIHKDDLYYAMFYNNPKEAFRDIDKRIIDQARKREYNMEETQAIRMHYKEYLENIKETWTGELNKKTL